MSGGSRKATLGEARRLEERALNASGAFQSPAYDGWLIGYRARTDQAAALRQPALPIDLPLAEKIEWCTRFCAAAKLPAILRMLPLAQPDDLDRVRWRRAACSRSKAIMPDSSP